MHTAGGLPHCPAETSQYSNQMPIIVIRRIQTVAHAAALLFGLCALAAGLALVSSHWM